MKTSLFTNWTNREIEGLLKSVTRYTRFVGITKISLLLLSLVLLGLVAFIPLARKDESGVRIMFSEVKPGSVTENPKMMRPHFEGVDSQNRPFSITSDEAEQQDNNIVVMRKIRADITMEKDEWLAVHSNEGVLDLTNKRLLLSGNVSMFYGDGYEIRTDKVYVDLDQGRAISEMKTEGQGPMGTLTATGFVVENQGDRINFKGPVKMIVNRKKT